MPAARFNRIMVRLVPALLLLGLQVVFLQVLRERAGAPAFAEDAAYAGLAMGERLAADHHYGLTGELDMPASRDALWHGLTSGLARLPGDPVRWVFLLNAVCGFFVLLILIRLAEHVFQHPPFWYASGMVVAVYPYLLEGAVGGTSLLLTTVLVLLALCLHIEGLLNERPLLSFSAAFCMALSATIHIELILIWGVMFIQALMVSLIKRERHTGFCLVQFVAGLLVCAILLWPLVHYNFKALHIPWPTSLDAVMAFPLDAGSQVTLESAWRGTAILQRIGDSCALWFAGNAGWSSFLWVLFLIATVIIGVSAVHEPVDRIMLLVPALAVIIPVVHGLLSVIIGQAALGPLFQVLLPLNLLFVVLAVFRLPHLVEWGLQRIVPEVSFLNVDRATWGSLCAILMVIGVSLTGTRLKDYLLRAEVRQAERAEFVAYAESLSWADTQVITDRPGWTGYTYGAGMLDLQGRYSPELLYCQSAGGFNRERFIDLVKRQRPAWVVIWDEPYAPHADLLVEALGPVAQSQPSYTGGPRVLALTWSGGL